MLYLMPYPRRRPRRPDLVEVFGAGVVSKLLLVREVPSPNLHGWCLDLRMDLKHLDDAESGP